MLALVGRSGVGRRGTGGVVGVGSGLFSRATFHSQSDSVQSRKGRASSLMRRSRVFWNTARCQAPPVLVATSVWMESRSGDGARRRASRLPPTVCITATSGPRNFRSVTCPTRRVPRSHLSNRRWLWGAITWRPLRVRPVEADQVAVGGEHRGQVGTLPRFHARP